MTSRRNSCAVMIRPRSSGFLLRVGAWKRTTNGRAAKELRELLGLRAVRNSTQTHNTPTKA